MFGAIDTFWSVNDGLARSYGTIPPVTYTSTTGGHTTDARLETGYRNGRHMSRGVADGQIHKYI